MVYLFTKLLSVDSFEGLDKLSNWLLILTVDPLFFILSLDLFDASFFYKTSDLIGSIFSSCVVPPTKKLKLSLPATPTVYYYNHFQLDCPQMKNTQSDSYAYLIIKNSQAKRCWLCVLCNLLLYVWINQERGGYNRCCPYSPGLAKAHRQSTQLSPSNILWARKQFFVAF